MQQVSKLSKYPRYLKKRDILKYHCFLGFSIPCTNDVEIFLCWYPFTKLNNVMSTSLLVKQ